MLPEWTVLVEARDADVEALLAGLAYLDARRDDPDRSRLVVRVRAIDGAGAVDYVRTCAERARIRPTLLQLQSAEEP